MESIHQISSRKSLVWWGPWYPKGHNNCRYAALLPRLPSIDPIYQHRGNSRWRHAVRSRLDRWVLCRLINPNFIKRLATKYQALFCTDVNQIPFFPGPIIVDDDDPVFTPGRIALLNRPNVIAVVTTTHQLREQFLRSGLVKPCHVIPSGVYLSQIDDIKIKELRKRLEKKDDDIVVGFSVPYLYTDQDREVRSTEAKLRSISFLAEVMEKVWKRSPKIRLWLMGIPSRSVRAYAQQHPQVRLLGYVPHIEVLNYFANFNIAVYPRLVDFSGRHSIKLVEFMAVGVPIVSTPVAESFHVSNAGAGLIADGVDGFAQQIHHLYSNPGLREALGAKGKEYAFQFDWDNLARHYESDVISSYTTSLLVDSTAYRSIFSGR